MWSILSFISCLISVTTVSLCTFSSLNCFKFLALQVWLIITPQMAVAISFLIWLQCLLLKHTRLWLIPFFCMLIPDRFSSSTLKSVIHLNSANKVEGVSLFASSHGQHYKLLSIGICNFASLSFVSSLSWLASHIIILCLGSVMEFKIKSAASSLCKSPSIAL